MDVSNSSPVQELYFLGFWHTTLKPETPEELVAHWCDYELSSVARGRAIVDVLQPLVDLAGAKVLDAGCGYGGASITFALAGSSVVGIDIDRERLRGVAIRAHYDYRISGVLFHCAMLGKLLFADAAFDVVLCADVIEHVQS